MQFEFIREAGSRGIRFFIPSNIDDQCPDDRGFREFSEQHEDSTLILIKCGHWPDSRGVSCDLYTLRKKSPVSDVTGSNTPEPPDFTIGKARAGCAFLLITGGLALALSAAGAHSLPVLQALVGVLTLFVGVDQISRGFRRG